MKALKELADLGAAAAFEDNKYHHYMSVSKKAHSWESDEPARQAFAQAVRDAVEKPLRDEITVMGAKIDELEKNVKLTSHSWFPHPPPTPTTKTVPLDMDDIRATDEFRCKELHIIETAQFWHSDAVELSYGMPQSYASLATSYLRRQHGSNEWKPCTKEISANQH